MMALRTSKETQDFSTEEKGAEILKQYSTGTKICRFQAFQKRMLEL
jgi:hypothetical protein